MLVFNITSIFSYPTNPEFANKHIYIYNHQVPEKFEEIFNKHAHTRPDAQTRQELQEMLKPIRDPKDYKGGKFS
jgi:hypothetical protein